MAFQLNELNQGIAYWRRRPNWPQDFHNDFYRCIGTEIQNYGLFNQQWWDAFLPRLRQWRATRPKSSAYLTARVKDCFNALNNSWNQNIVPVIGQDIEAVEWQNIAPFVRLVAEIKNVESPVFSSKLCHFLAPHIFPVVDNAAVGNHFDSYETYFNAVRTEWCETDNYTKGKLTDLITNKIGYKMLPNYPVKCKVIELCLIGRNQNNG